MRNLIAIILFTIAGCSSNSTKFTERGQEDATLAPLEQEPPPEIVESLKNSIRPESISPEAINNEMLVPSEIQQEQVLGYSAPFLASEAEQPATSAKVFCQKMLFKEEQMPKDALPLYFHKKSQCGELKIQSCLKIHNAQIEQTSFVFSPISDLHVPCQETFFELVKVRHEFAQNNNAKSHADLFFDPFGQEIKEISLSNTSCDESNKWIPFTDRIEAWPINWDEDQAMIYIKFKDKFLLESECIRHTLQIIPASITIDSGARATTQFEVTLDLTAAATQMYITNNKSCSEGGEWQDYTSQISWKLADQGADRFEASVYALFKDHNHNLSECTSASILFDQVAPKQISLSLTNGLHTTTAPEIELMLDAQEAAEVYITTSEDCLSGGQWEPFEKTKSFTLEQENALNSIFIKYRSENKVESTCESINIYYDSKRPSVAINRQSEQVNPAQSLPIAFDIAFSEKIDPSTLTPEVIIQNGTATGVDWSIKDSGDQQNFTLEATAVATLGSLIPVLPAGKVTDAAGLSNTLSQSSEGQVDYGIPLIVEPRFSSAAHWNDYARSPSYSDATDDDDYSLTCSDKTTQKDRPTDCVHGGEHRKVIIPGITSCAGLILEDQLQIFDWKCEDKHANAVFFTNGFKENKGLGDLLNPTAFKNNKVVLSGANIGVSEERSWWANEVEAIAATPSRILLNDSNKVYTVSENLASAGFSIRNSNIALVVLPGFKVTFQDNAPTDNCDMMFGDDCLLDSVIGGDKYGYLWIEGNFDANGASAGIHIGSETIHHSRFHNLHISNAENYAISGGGEANIFTNTAIYNTTSIGAAAFAFWTPVHNLLVNLKLVNNENHSLISNNGSNLNIIGLLATNNTFGLYAGSSERVSVVNATTVHNGANSNGGGVTLDTRNTLLNLASFADFSGLTIWGTNNTVVQAAISAFSWDIYSPTNPNSLYGSLFANSSSMNADPSFSITRDLAASSFAHSFVGLVSSDANNSDENASGQVSYSTQIDWTHFDNPMRSWGHQYAGDFLSQNIKGPAKSNMQIWDWSLSQNDSILRNTTGNGSLQNELLINGQACPAFLDGTKAENVVMDKMNLAYYPGINAVESTADDSDTICETGEASCNNLFLLRASEIALDLIGDDDGLCETGEACLYTPNFGAYQGHGDYKNHTCNYPSASPAPGQVTGVTMHFYPINGR